jgi:diaminopimelate decarboxylase
MEIGRKFGHRMDILDLGGGYPAGEIPEGMMQALKLTENDPLGYTVLAEPGRHISS